MYLGMNVRFKDLSLYSLVFREDVSGMVEGAVGKRQIQKKVKDRGTGLLRSRKKR